MVAATPLDRCSSHVVTTKPAQAGFVVTGPQVQYSFCDAFGVILSWARPTGREITKPLPHFLPGSHLREPQFIANRLEVLDAPAVEAHSTRFNAIVAQPVK